MVIPSPTKPLGRSRPKPDNRLLWLDIITMFLWGVVMMQYWLTGKLRLLVHPAFSWLCIVAGFYFC